MIYTRNTYTTDNLSADDFISGIGFDMDLLNTYYKRKGIKIKSESFYLFSHHDICGEWHEANEHPLLGRKHIDNVTLNEVGIIESVHKHWYYGFYYAMIYRKNGTRSHGVLQFENINSVSDVIINSVNDFKLHYNIV